MLQPPCTVQADGSLAAYHLLTVNSAVLYDSSALGARLEDDNLVDRFS